MYQLILSKKLKGVDFSSKTIDLLEAFRARTGEVVNKIRLWKAARDGITILKARDLLWRLLHGRVMTGTKLTWIESDQQHCPIQHCDLTIQHIWIDCTVAITIWSEVIKIWNKIDPEVEIIKPLTINELIVSMALCPQKMSGSRQRRWKTSLSFGDLVVRRFIRP